MPELNLKGSTGKLQVKNLGEGRKELYIYGDIVDSEWEKWDWESDFAPSDVKNFIDQLDGSNAVDIRINSYGGSLFAGLAIYNQIKGMNADVTVYVDGVAASSASIIALAGKKLVMPSNALFMIHKPMLGAGGNADELRRAADMLDTCQQAMMQVYKDNMRDGVELSTIEEMVNKETWLTAEQAAEYFNIELESSIEVAAKAPESSIYGQYKHVPSIIKDSENPAAKGDKPKKEGVENVSEFEKKVQAKFGDNITVENIAEWKQKAEDHAELETKVQNLSADAELGKQYKKDLIQNAAESRVRAQGKYFTGVDSYKTALENAPIDYIKAEIETYESLVKNQFTAGRDTHDQTVQNNGRQNPEENIIE